MSGSVPSLASGSSSGSLRAHLAALPPSGPSTPASPQAAPTVPDTPGWPDGPILFLDPLSDKSAKLRSNLQRQVPPPAMTGFIFEATHLVIDPASLFGPAALRACTPDQRVVTNEWLKESILTQDWAPEDLYEYQQPVELPAVASPGPGPPKEEPQDGSSSGVGVSKWKRWLPEEDDLLVRFLVPVVGKPNVKGTDGQDAFDRYAASGATTRTALALRTRYYEHPRWYEETISKVRADLEQDADAQLMPSMTSEERESRIRRREEKRRAVERPPSEPNQHESAEDENEVSEDDSPVDIASGPVRYTDQEEADFRRVLGESPTLAIAARAMIQLHPRREYKAVRKRFQNHRSTYLPLLNLAGAPRPLKAPAAQVQRLPRWTEEEESALVTCLVKSKGTLSSVLNAFVLLHRRRTIGAAGQYYRDHKARIDLAVASIKASANQRPRSSQAVSRPPSSSAKRAAAILDPGHLSKRPRVDDGPSPIASSSNSRIDGLGPPPARHEPASFLALGTAPASCQPSSPFCYWCGRDGSDAESFPFRPIKYATPSMSARRLAELDRRCEQTACSPCADWIKDKKRKYAAELDELNDEMKMLEWKGEKLRKHGERARQAAVGLHD